MDSDFDPLDSDSDSDSGPVDSDSDSGPVDSDSRLMDSDSGLMDSDSDSDSGLVDSDSLSDSRVRTHSNTGNLLRPHLSSTILTLAKCGPCSPRSSYAVILAGENHEPIFGAGTVGYQI